MEVEMDMAVVVVVVFRESHTWEESFMLWKL
jgi:hypothetical protein